DCIRDLTVTGVQTCALPICLVQLPDVSEDLAAFAGKPHLVVLQACQDLHVVAEELAAHLPRVRTAGYVATLADVVLRGGRYDPEIGRASCRGRVDTPVGPSS